MKILILQDDFPPASYGGAGMVAFSQAKEISQRGHEVFVVTCVQDPSDEGEVELEGLKVYRIFSNYSERWRGYLSLYNPRTVKKIKTILDLVKPDVVHAHNVHYHLSFHALKLAKASGAKVFLTAHDVMLFHYGKLVGAKSTFSGQLRHSKLRFNPFRKLVIKKYLKYVDKIIAVSEALKQALNKNGINNVEVIHNGIDAREWIVKGSAIEEFKTHHNLKDKKIVLFGGRLSALKGGELAVRMVAEIARKIPNVVLMVIGKQNEYAEEMKKLASKLGVSSNILFIGWVSGIELKAAYHASMMVAVLSLYLDPFPTVVLEAMACHKPVLATNLGGAKEVVLDGQTGYVVSPHSLDILVNKASDLLLDSSKQAEFGLAGFKNLMAHFTLEAQVGKLLKYYEL